MTAPRQRPRDGAAGTLVTGATGYLGAFLTAELLSAPGRHVHCLVRAKDEAEGLRRVRESLVSRGAWNESWTDRLHAVPGDLAAPRLGLSHEAAQTLSDEIDEVFHSGANTSFLFGAPMLRKVNVDGTAHLLDLARIGRPKSLHFVSSISIFLTGARRGGPALETEIPEEDELPDAWGYSKTKLAAEHLVRGAAEKGLAATIYRPWFIGPHTRSGVAAADFKMSLIEGCLRLRCAPALDLVMNIAPVDYVSSAIVRLARRDDARGRVFHLGNPAPTTWSAVVESLRERGHEIESVPFEEWRRRLRRNPDNPAFAFYLLLPESLSAGTGLTLLDRLSTARVPGMDDRNTANGLRGSGLSCPLFQGAPLDAYLRRRSAGETPLT